ncbi:MAG: VWA domain-containing protein [Candidatus Acidiferrales bacterium]
MIMRQIVKWMIVAIFAFPIAAISQSQPQSQQPPPPQQQSSPQPQPEVQTPGSVEGHSQAPAQKTAPAPQQTNPRRTITNVSALVLVPVTVKNSSGQIAGDLRRDEFRVFEDGREQQLSMFSTDPYPLSVVILLDNDLSMKMRDQVQKSLSSIAAALGPSDEAALMRFDEFPEPVQDFTKDNDALYTQLRRLQLGESFPGDAIGPMTAGPQINNQSQEPQVPIYGMKQEKVVKDLDDAVYAAGQLLRARDPKRDRRKMIFLIADGQNSHHNKYTFNQALQLLLSSDISVYTITVGSALIPKHEPARMTRYANDTGGDAYFASKQGDFERLYSTVTEEARNQYTLAYVPQNNTGGEYHAIEVRVERPGLHVNARQGYYEIAH